MTKSEFIAMFARQSGLSIQEGDKIINAFLASVEDGLCADGRVALPGLGIFEVKESAARTGRNPRTKEPIEIPAQKNIRFKMAKELKERLNNGA